jgi:hypothetical protein
MLFCGLSDIVSINLARVTIYTLSIWSLIASLIANSSSSPATDYFPAIFLFTGWAVIVVLAVVLLFARERVAWCVRGTWMHPIGVWLSDVEVPMCRPVLLRPLLVCSLASLRSV